MIDSIMCNPESTVFVKIKIHFFCIYVAENDARSARARTRWTHDLILSIFFFNVSQLRYVIL